jgi:hypothetical protein
MPDTLYGQVTGYDTLRYCRPSEGAPYEVTGVCMAYLSQLVNWPFRKVTDPITGLVYYQSDFNRFDTSTCDLLGVDPAPIPGTPLNNGAFLRFHCTDEVRCTWADPFDYAIYSCKATGCNTPEPFTEHRLYPAFFLDQPRVATSMGWKRSGVLSCDPFWGRIEFFDAVIGGNGDPAHSGIPPLGDLGGDTCDQSGHPNPPCCVAGPCGLDSLPPYVADYGDGVGGACNFGSSVRAPLALSIDFTESPI